MKIQTILLLIVLSFSGVLWAGTVKEEITALLMEQDAAWNRGDLDGFMKPYDDSPELVFMGSDGPVRSSQVLKEHYESKYKTGQSDFGKLTFSELEVEELAPGIARAWGKWQVEQKDQTLSGWFTLILQKKQNGWRIIHDHSS
jgi:ketosteroid isomerase-like protein